MDLQEISKDPRYQKLEEFNSKVLELEIEILNHSVILEKAKVRMAEEKKKIENDIAAEMTDGKKKFTNSETRYAEFIERIKKSQDYTDREDMIGDLQVKILSKRIEASYVREQMYNLRLFIK
jgi:hypothetical protein